MINKLQKWAELVAIQDDIRLRNPGSKHQKQIRLIQDLVQEAKVNPSESVLEKIREVKPVSCLGQSPYVAYCRYLQYTAVQLENVLKDEGKMENEL